MDGYITGIIIIIILLITYIIYSPVNKNKILVVLLGGYLLDSAMRNYTYHGADDNIKWVRGTNTTIFLSCYKQDNGDYCLMSKGDQYRNGFVPMSETMDGGINSLKGVNWYAISSYPFSNIKDSGEYSLRYLKFDVDDIKNTILTSQYLADVGAIVGCIRLKQYGINDQDVLDKVIGRRNNLMEFIDNVFSNQNKILQLLDLDVNDYKHMIKYEDGKIIRQSYIDFRNAIASKIGFRTTSAGINLFDCHHQNTALELRDGYVGNIIKGHGVDNASLDFVSNLIYYKFYDDAEQHIQFKERLRAHCHLIMDNANTLKDMYEIAVGGKTGYVLTDDDKIILNNLIPIIVCSTNETSMRRPNKNAPEIIILNRPHIGPKGVNIIYVRSQDERQLKALLDEKEINGVEIRVNDDYF